MSGEFPEDVVVMVTEALQLVIQVFLHHILSQIHTGVPYNQSLNLSFPLAPSLPPPGPLQIDPAVTTSCASQILPAAMSLFLKYSHGKIDC